MTQVILIGVGAGATAALLFGSVASGNGFSLILFSLASLPIMIAALGWSHWAGLVAAVGRGLAAPPTAHTSRPSTASPAARANNLRRQ